MNNVEETILVANQLDNAVLGETRGRPISVDLFKHSKGLYNTHYLSQRDDAPKDAWIIVATSYNRKQLKQTAKRYNEKNHTMGVPDTDDAKGGNQRIIWMISDRTIADENNEDFGKKEYLLLASLFIPENWESQRQAMGV